MIVFQDGDGKFLTTQWTELLNSEEGSSDAVSEILVTLCENYHYPVYAFIRNRCRDVEKARDLTQGFFEHLIETKFYRNADRERGRFRTFLLLAVKGYLSKEFRASVTQKRGGGAAHLSLDLDESEQSYHSELVSETSNDTLFDHDWAVAVFDRVWNLLRAEYEEKGQLDRFNILKPTVTDPVTAVSYSELAKKLSLTEGGLKVTVFRLKGRFRELFREIVAQIVESPKEVDEEINYLIQAMTRDPYQ